MRSRPSVAAVCAAAALAGGSVLLAAPAAAEPVAVTCGDVVTTDAYLAADTSCAAGLTLVGDVTLDLQGHTLRGEGSGTAITVTVHSTQSVVNGRVEDWSTALALTTPPAPQNFGGRFWFADLTFAGNDLVMDLTLDTIFGRNGDVTFVESRFEDNGLVLGGSSGPGVMVFTSEFARNTTVVRAQGTVLHLDASRFESNDVVVADLGGSALTLASSELVGNRVVLAGGDVGGFASLITNEISGSDAVVVPTAADVAVGGNHVVDNDVAIDLGAGSGFVFDNTFERNRVAFTSTGPPAGSEATVRLHGNTFTENGDAVVTAGAGTEVWGNVAHHNTGWGIYAPGVTDGGENRAWANGRYPQCVGVVCAGKPRS
ncbi:hypothetical protein ACWFNE_13300 [Cellulomonas sp. NPDC055163]